VLAVFTRSAAREHRRPSIVRGLRFRLAVSYLLFFAVLLGVLGLVFRGLLEKSFSDQSANLLAEEWGALKGYLKIEHQQDIWYFDRFDPEESLIVSRIQHVFILMDANGNIVDRSPVYSDDVLPTPSIAEIREVLRSTSPVITVVRGTDGVEYMIRAGVIPEERRAGSPEPKHDYYVAIGRPMVESKRTVRSFTWRYFALMPFILALAGIIGWILAARALAPVRSVAHAASRIRGSNLTVQIPPRGAGDELDQLIDAFNRMTTRLKQSFDQIRQFSTDVSHELRTPLTGIRGQLEVALFTAETTEQYREAMVNALQDVEQLSNMVRALLMLSQAESGQLALQRAPVDVSQIAMDIADQYQIPAEADGVTLNCTAPEPCWVEGDKTQLERLVANLISNGIKYTPQGGTISVAVECRDEDALLLVRDTGVGIPQQNLPHIFDRFYRVPGAHTSSKQGLGLGLSFVAWNVHAHGGKIDVESTPGKGTTFCLTLRRTEAPAPGESRPKETARQQFLIHE